MLTPNKKKYLFSIYEIGLKNGSVRSVDIVRSIKINKASVSNMLPVLIEDGVIERKTDGTIGLTETGASLAAKFYARYTVLYQFFKNRLNSPEESARNDALACVCNLSDENTENMKNYFLEDTAR